MSKAKALTYWVAAALEKRRAEAAVPVESPHGSKAYLDIQLNFAGVSGTWENCASENGTCNCLGQVRYGKDPNWSIVQIDAGAYPYNG